MGAIGSSRHRRPDAIIIVVCGKAGAGKSTFINTATRSTTMPVNHSQSPQRSSDVLHAAIGDLGRVRFKDGIIFLEVPSLVSLELEEETSVEQDLQTLLESLRNDFRHIRICGLLYLHPITDIDYPDSRARYWALLTRLRRNRYIDQLPGTVVLVTTKWESSHSQASSYQLETQRKRQKELRMYWHRLPREPVSSIVMSFHEYFERAWLIIAASTELRDGDILRRAIVKEGKRREWEKWDEAESKWEWEHEKRMAGEKELARIKSGKKLDKGVDKEGAPGKIVKYDVEKSIEVEGDGLGGCGSSKGKGRSSKGKGRRKKGSRSDMNIITVELRA
ncbi:hypothetical protein D9756_007201 [Leucocoprinus leucothites]|uniref:G domain-containing protein n=1 Tax=Leucocoprinus leucothites TaxID=201217 RepID=A0A8H5FZ50_9AGAR|nr:hypothetical protein D9756_007201 [Leucoagaricus leucothites]